MKLFLLAPAIVFKARVNQAAFTYPLDAVTYDGVTVGTYSVVAISQLVLFGSTEGADDLGRSWVRLFPTSNTLYIGRSSQGTRDGEVTLQDNAYITVLDLFVVANKTPYIDADGELFKNSDVAFDGQTDESNPVANAGSAFAATIDPDTEVITVTLTAAGSFATAPGAAIVSTIWEVDDGTITVGAFDDEEITVTFPAGFRYARLTVADDNANSHQAVVPILAIDPEADPCIDGFTIERHTITPAGQQISVTVRQAIDRATYPEGTLAMIIDGEPYDSNDRDNVIFMGWVDTEPAAIEAAPVGLLAEVELNLLDVAGRLRQLPGFSQIMENASEPESWAQATTPNMDRFIHYLLDWSSTALNLADFYWSGTGATYIFRILASDGASLWDQVARKAQALTPDYVFTCDRRGRLRILPDPMLQDPGDRATTTQGALTPADWAGLRYQAQRAPTVHWLRASAILTSSILVPAVFSIAPGLAPGQGLATIDDGNRLAVSQDALNAYAGHAYARANAPYGLFTVALAGGNNDAFEPALMQWVALTISSASQAPRGLAFDEGRFLLRQMEIRYSYGLTGTTKSIQLTLERETSGSPGVTWTPAAADPVAGDDNDYIPPDTSTDPPSFDGGIESGAQNIALITDDGRTIRTSNFQSSPPTWTVDNSAESSINGDGMGFVVDPFSPFYRTGSGTVDGFYVTTTKIYKLEDLFGTTTATELHTFAESITTAGGRWRSIACSFGRYQPVEADNPWIMVVTNYNDFGTKKGTYCIYSTDGGQTWSSEIQITSERPTGSLIGTRYWPTVWMSPRTPGYAIVVAKTQTGAIGGTGAYYTNDWGATWQALTLPAVTTSPQATTGGLAGGALHVPWPDNTDEQIIYHGYEVEQSSEWDRYLYRTTGASSEDITPAAGNYGPRRGLFAVRSHDNDRRYMVAVLASSDDDEIGDEESAVFVSADYGDTWTLVMGPTTTAANTQFPTEAAFSADDRNVILVWGNEAMIQYSNTFGASWEDKRGSLSFTGGEEILGLVGG